jgi:hypothetical protein
MRGTTVNKPLTCGFTETVTGCNGVRG